MPRLAIYPGSFDPITNGHLNLIRRGVQLFDGLVVAVVANPRKNPLLTIAERVDLIHAAVGDDARIEVDAFEGLLVDYAKRRGVPTVLRGLRALSDFEYEFEMALMNRRLDPAFETVFMMTGEDNFFVSSGLVREVALLGGNVRGFVPQPVWEALERKFGRGAGG